MFNHAGKKGQEGVTLTTLLLIVLGAVVVVVIILGATGGFEYVFGLFDFGPQDLQKLVLACETYGSGGLRADYCSTFREVEINGVEQYVTCSYTSIENQLTEDKKLEGSCTNSVSAKREFCLSGSVKGSDFSKVPVNGETCASVLDVKTTEVCPQTQLKASCSSDEFDITSFVKKSEGENANKLKCCLPRAAAAPVQAVTSQTTPSPVPVSP